MSVEQKPPGLVDRRLPATYNVRDCGSFSMRYARSFKNAAASEFGADIIKEHYAVMKALREGDVEAARTSARTRFERAADRLAARADFA